MTPRHALRLATLLAVAVGLLAAGWLNGETTARASVIFPTMTPTATPLPPPVLSVLPSSGLAGTMVSLSLVNLPTTFLEETVTPVFQGSSGGAQNFSSVLVAPCANGGAGFGAACNGAPYSATIPAGAPPGGASISVSIPGLAPATTRFIVIASPTATATALPPSATATSLPPTPTATRPPPTSTPTATLAPSATRTPSPVPPSPTRTSTAIPPTITTTPLPPTDTDTPLPPTATATPTRAPPTRSATPVAARAAVDTPSTVPAIATSSPTATTSSSSTSSPAPSVTASPTEIPATATLTVSSVLTASPTGTVTPTATLAVVAVVGPSPPPVPVAPSGPAPGPLDAAAGAAILALVGGVASARAGDSDAPPFAGRLGGGDGPVENQPAPAPFALPDDRPDAPPDEPWSGGAPARWIQEDLIGAFFLDLEPGKGRARRGRAWVCGPRGPAPADPGSAAYPTSDLHFEGTFQGDELSGQIAVCWSGPDEAPTWELAPLHLTLDSEGDRLVGTWYDDLHDRRVGIALNRVQPPLLAPDDVGLPPNNLRVYGYGVRRAHRKSGAIVTVPEDYPFDPDQDDAVSRHLGIDFTSRNERWAPASLPFQTPLPGVVRRYPNSPFNTVGIQLDTGDWLQFLHASRIEVLDGRRVEAGTVLGWTGAAGVTTLQLHVQARDARGLPADPDAVVARSRH